MRKLSVLFSLFMLLTAFTCENEPLEGDFINEEISNDNASLVGTWTLMNFSADINSVISFGGIEFVLDFSTEAVTSNYELTFTDTNYTVFGDYELTSSTTFDGETTTFTEAYTDVGGAGVYSTQGNTMTVDGSFFELNVEGVPMELAQGEQMAEFELSPDGQTLTFSQDEVQTQNEAGSESTTSTVSISVWQRVE